MSGYRVRKVATYTTSDALKNGRTQWHRGTRYHCTLDCGHVVDVVRWDGRGIAPKTARCKRCAEVKP